MSAITKALGLADNASEADILKALEARDTASAALIEKMTDAQTLYFGKMKDPADREAFQKAKSADRDAAMAKKPKGDDDADDVEKALKSGDAFKSIDGALVLKSKVGPDTFAILKGMDDGRRVDRLEIEKARDEKITKQYEDRAVELGFAKDFGATIRKAYGGDAAAQVELEKQMTALRKQAETGGAFTELGKRGSPEAGSAEAELMAKRDALMSVDKKLTAEQAFAKVWKARENVELVKRYRSEQSAAH